jgi:2-polyprenyl-3-methyl-5-hydroxy-6-metoxy-1,4-benzoquinol methylase
MRSDVRDSIERGWRELAAIERDGTFLDVGCATGFLMESVHRWAKEA